MMYSSKELLRPMTDMFGGIRFRSMHLFRVGRMLLLLDVCAETLETIRFHPADPCREQLYQRILRFETNNPA